MATKKRKGKYYDTPQRRALKNILVKRGWTARYVGELTNRSVHTIRNYVGGQRAIPDEVLSELKKL